MVQQCVVITNPMIAANRSAEVTLSKFLRVITPIYTDITVIGGNISLEGDLGHIQVCSMPIMRSSQKIRRAIDMFKLQFWMAKQVRKRALKDIPVYFWIGDKMILPFWAAKGRKADIRYFIYGNVLKEGHPSLFTKISAKLITYMANHVNSVCVESPEVIQEWQGGICNRNIRQIHLYTQIGDCTAVEERENTIGMLCRLTPGKHVVECIHAFAKVRKTYPEYSLEIIGSGRQEEECRNAIRSLNAENYITMHGWIDHDQVFVKTSKWKYLLFPSDTEGLPNSVLEMMGKGIPVIASAVGGIRDLVVDGQNGWLLDDNTVCGISESLLRAVRSLDYRIISANALQTVKEEYVIDAAIKRAMING